MLAEIVFKLGQASHHVAAGHVDQDYVEQVATELHAAPQRQKLSVKVKNFDDWPARNQEKLWQLVRVIMATRRTWQLVPEQANLAGF